MEKGNRGPIRTEFRRQASAAAVSDRGKIYNWLGSRHPADADLNWFVGVRWHQYASCYVWTDCPIYDSLGEVIGHHRGNTIYIDRAAGFERQDLLHELGHAVGRHFDIVGHHENHYTGAWDRRARRLVGAVTSGRHWSRYLNWHAAQTRDFAFSAASEVWAELFMLFYLYPQLPEAKLIEGEIELLRRERDFCRLEASLNELLPRRLQSR